MKMSYLTIRNVTVIGQLSLWRDQAWDRSVHAFHMEEKFGFPLPVLWRGKLTLEMLDTKKIIIFHDGDKQLVWQVRAFSSSRGSSA